VSKHTPGPWKVSMPLIKAPARGGYYELGGVAQVLGDKHVPDINEQEANARLIAAAPEMLEALKLISELDNCFDEKEYDHLKSMADKAMLNAIAKAEGR
jgi:hypothetical protein